MRFTALDSWRGICALIVALFHFPLVGAVKAFPAVAHGYLFVDFFFVLSGFVIATAYEDRLTDEDAGWRFVIRRFGRLWPLHALMLAVFVLAAVAKGEFGDDERHSLGAVFTNLALVHGLGVHDDLTWNGPSWSISVEAVLYLLFALLAPMPKRVVVYAAFLVIGVVVLAFRAPNGMASTFDFGAFRGLAGFFMGVLLTRFAARDLGTAGEIFAVLLAGTFVWLGKLTLLSPFVFGLVVYVFAYSSGAVGRTLTVKPAVLLGDWSYSVYMVHAAVGASLWAVASRIGLDSGREGLFAQSGNQEAMVVVGYLGVTVVISAVTYTLVEKPGREFFNRLASFKPIVGAA